MPGIYDAYQRTLCSDINGYSTCCCRPSVLANVKLEQYNGISGKLFKGSCDCVINKVFYRLIVLR